MMPTIISFLYFISFCASSNPILFSDNPSAVPVQSFDFVYIPKEVVHSHLPAFEKKRLQMRAEHAIKELKLKMPVPQDTTTQLQLVGLLKRKQISEKDPNGEKRKTLKKELCQMNTELNLLVPHRKNLIADIQRLQRTTQRECSPTNLNSRLSDKQDAECRAMKEYITFQSSQLMEMNQREKIYLQRIQDIRKEITLL